MLLKSKESKVVLVAFTQHCIQSNVTHFVTHIERVKSVKYYVLYSVYMSCGFSGSPPVSLRRQLC